MAVLAVTQLFYAHETCMVTDAVILLAIVLFAIAAFTDGFLEDPLLLQPGLNRFFRIIVLAAEALTDSRPACAASLTADTVELAAMATFAITMLFRDNSSVCLRFFTAIACS